MRVLLVDNLPHKSTQAAPLCSSHRLVCRSSSIGRTLSKGLRLACICLLCSDTWGTRVEEGDEAAFGAAAAAHMKRMPIVVVTLLLLLQPRRE